MSTLFIYMFNAKKIINKNNGVKPSGATLRISRINPPEKIPINIGTSGNKTKSTIAIIKKNGKEINVDSINKDKKSSIKSKIL